MICEILWSSTDRWNLSSPFSIYKMIAHNIAHPHCTEKVLLLHFTVHIKTLPLHRKSPIAAFHRAHQDPTIAQKKSYCCISPCTSRPYHCTHYTQDCYSICNNPSALVQGKETPVADSRVFVCKDREQQYAVMGKWVCNNF
jgi:hypothetical protein